MLRQPNSNDVTQSIQAELERVNGPPKNSAASRCTTEKGRPGWEREAFMQFAIRYRPRIPVRTKSPGCEGTLQNRSRVNAVKKASETPTLRCMDSEWRKKECRSGEEWDTGWGGAACGFGGPSEKAKAERPQERVRERGDGGIYAVFRSV